MHTVAIPFSFLPSIRAFKRGPQVLKALAVGVINSFLDALLRNTSYANATVYVKLHIGAPGSAGANNAAANTSRQQATFNAASSGATTNTSDVVWTNVSNSETYSHISLWSASSGGTFLGEAALAGSQAVVAGNNFRIVAGDLDISGS